MTRSHRKTLTLMDICEHGTRKASAEVKRWEEDVTPDDIDEAVSAAYRNLLAAQRRLDELQRKAPAHHGVFNARVTLRRTINTLDSL